MSEALTAKISLNLQATLENPLNLSTPIESVFQNIVQAFTSGTGAAQVNRLFTKQGTIAAGDIENIDLWSFSAAEDSLGRTYKMIGVKLLLLQNLNTIGDDVLFVGSGDGSAGWYSGFGEVSQTVIVRGGGIYLMVAPDAAGYTVLSAVTDGIFKIRNVAVNPITYNLYILGIQ